MEQNIHYCTTTDGVNLAYATIGDGPPLVKVANWLSHLDFDWYSPVFRHWLQALASDHLLIRYDERGCGLSEWDVEDMSFEAWLSDLEAVIDAVGVERFPLLGISQGGPIAVAYAVRHPERVSHLILYGSYAQGKLHRGLTPQQLEEAQTLINLIRLGWGQDNPAFWQVFSTLFIPSGTPEQWNWFNELQRISSTPENAARIVSGFDQIDVTDLAPQVSAPTLVLHSRGDARIPFEQGQLLASLIPGAEFISLDSNNHILLEDDPAWPRFIGEVRRFLGVSGKQPIKNIRNAGDTVAGHFRSASVLFADMAGFTRLSAELSLDTVIEILDDVFSHFDKIIDQYGLEKIHLQGDEILVAAGLPRPRPDHCQVLAMAALDMATFVDGLPLYGGEKIQFRFGMNTGPVTAAMIGRSKLQYEIWGDTVNVASRMESTGVPGQIQITESAYQLLQEQFLCQPRGNLEVKGKGSIPTWFLTGRK